MQVDAGIAKTYPNITKRPRTYGTSSYSVDTYLKTIVAVFIEGVRKPVAKSPSNDSENQRRKERK